PGGRVHRQELLRTVLLRVLPGEHLSARRLRARSYHAAGLRRGRADGPVGGRVLQPVGFLTADPESLITGGHKNYGAGSASPAPDWRIRRARWRAPDHRLTGPADGGAAAARRHPGAHRRHTSDLLDHERAAQ